MKNTRSPRAGECRPALSTPSIAAALALAVTFLVYPPPGNAQAPPPLLHPTVLDAMAGELSGTEARRTVEELALHHRQRGSRGFRAAAEAIHRLAAAAGLEEVEILELPADGEIFYGTQRSRPAWDADFAELWELEPGTDGEWSRHRRVASYQHRPVTLAQDSASGQAVAELVDVGAGTREEDYQGPEIAGRLVLVSSQPGAVYPLAVTRFGAAGIISYAPNQRSAWWLEDETLVRWGHMGTFPEPTTFGFMVSLQQARRWQQRLAAGEAVMLEARVEAGQHPGAYLIPTAAIRGAHPALAQEEIAFSCHLDHQLPGANDNASGCAAILEVARALAKLVAEERLPRPRRTLRFYWPPEIEGTIALLVSRPELAERTRAVVHMDMVGGHTAVTKAIFHVTRGPRSLPSFVHDVAEAFGRFVNAQSHAHAGGGDVRWPLVDPEGGKEALQAVMAPFSMGSDHQVWAEGSFQVPSLYFNDWPDRYIHTHADHPRNIDSTKLLRAAFLGAASSWYLANLDAEGLPALYRLLERHGLERAAAALARAEELQDAGERTNLLRHQLDFERRILESVEPFALSSPEQRAAGVAYLTRLSGLLGRGLEAAPPPTGRVYRRHPEVIGPMDGFGYSYLQDQIQRRALEPPGLLAWQGLWGDGAEAAYEALNLVDGRRSTSEIRDAVAASYGPVSLALIEELLELLAKIGVIQ